MNTNYLKTVLKITGLLIVLQLLRIGIRYVCFLVIERTELSDRIISLIAMVLISSFILLTAKLKEVKLSVFPAHFGAGYLVFTVVYAALLISTPILTQSTSFTGIFLLIYSAIIIPAFEELIFRGFVWNELNNISKKEWITYLLSTLLFAIWHLGYIDTISFRVESGLATVMIWKVITGFCFGIVLGALRIKTKNIFSTILLHGILNIFGR
ncbi:CPBP family intramembrane glutamic endopeptidase [Lacrimispora sp. 38-1]|uniref:CPBP family intramembrane glutamic endopeptidase n=1 Tax=Lacrimispora sp. 38-1 TaxID=3125778 RepID=UPI003CE79972